jgi:D-alanine-D-alanine ligase
MHIAVLMGGPSPEHDISLASGEEVAASLLRQGFQVSIVVIGRDGGWRLPPEKEAQNPNGAGAAVRGLSGKNEGLDPARAILDLRARKVDLAFLALHGRYGEDGTIQGFLEAVPLPYTGSGVMASSLAMDKIRSKKVLRASGLAVPDFTALSGQAWDSGPDQALADIEKKLSYPLVVKPAAAGSSVGTSIPKDREALARAVEAAFEHSGEILLEAYVRGVELTCPVLGNPGDPAPATLPVVEIVPKTSDFFDYEAKYTPGATDEIAPARIDDATAGRAAETAVSVHRVLGCAGLTRTDMILSDDNLYVLEINTIPGLSAASICPKAAVAAGRDFDWLTREMVGLAGMKA